MALASPIISIGHGQPTSWQDAIDNGNIQSVNRSGPNDLSDQAQEFYTNSVIASVAIVGPLFNSTMRMPALLTDFITSQVIAPSVTVTV